MKVRLWKKGRFGRPYTVSCDLECFADAPDALIKVGDTEGILLQVDESDDGVKLSLISRKAYDKAQQAMIVPLATSHLRIQCDAHTLAVLKNHLSRGKSPHNERVPTTVPLPTPATVATPHGAPAPTLASLQARYAALDKPRKPDIDNLKERFLALRDGDSTGPVFNSYSTTTADESVDDIVGWAQSMTVQQPDEEFEKIIMEAANWKEEIGSDDVLAKEKMDTAAIIDEARNLVRDARGLTAHDEEHKGSGREDDEEDEEEEEEANTSSSSSSDDD